MEETLSIINLSTQKSLCFIDELGRGTSTFDGYSIASSVLNYIIHHRNPLCIFSTHYHFIL